MTIDLHELQARIEAAAAKLGREALQKGLVYVTAESCTAGGVSYAVTQIAGSSAWFDRGFVTYTNEAKQQLLGVRSETLKAHGAVSEETAREMALGALCACPKANCAASVTGIAGPGGAVPGKPVGTVCFGFAFRAEGTAQPTVKTATEHFAGGRSEVRMQSILRALDGLIEASAQRKNFSL